MFLSLTAFDGFVGFFVCWIKGRFRFLKEFIMKKILISIVVISFWNCGEGDSDDFNGAPEIYQIFPSILLALH